MILNGNYISMVISIETCVIQVLVLAFFIVSERFVIGRNVHARRFCLLLCRNVL